LELKGGGHVADVKPETLSVCLSGGGFRASLFHLGALRRLNEVGLLEKAAFLLGVSGGSIIAAHLAEATRSVPNVGVGAAALPLSEKEWEMRVAQPFRELTALNLRRRFLRIGLGNRIRRRSGSALAQLLHDLLTPMRIADLPESPQYVFVATNLGTGRPFVLTRAVTTLVFGTFDGGRRQELFDIDNRYVAEAVAASSAFPGVVEPVILRGRSPDPSRVTLVDGGVVDNTGLIAFEASRLERRGTYGHPAEPQYTLVSDGGGVLKERAWTGGVPVVSALRRAFEISDQRSREVQRLLFLRRAKPRRGLSWSTARYRWEDFDPLERSVEELLRRATPPSADTYRDEVAIRISEIRTDLDAFTDAEVAILENHGYLECAATLATAAKRNAGPHGYRDDTPLKVPWPAFGPDQSTNWLLSQLADSHRTLLRGRGDQERRLQI
jgi:NTE family protein